jgi:phosphinothricin acetyltransferase
MGDFTPDPIHLDEIKRRRKVMLKRKMPHMVAESNGAIVGYAYAAPFRKRPAYRFTVEHSIYVDKDHLRLGVGRCLLPALIRECTEAGFHQMIAVIDSTNLPSLGLHEAFGFERSGLLRSVGFKFGQWTDSVLMQRLLVSEAPADAPSPNEGGDGDGESRID